MPTARSGLQDLHERIESLSEYSGDMPIKKPIGMAMAAASRKPRARAQIE